MGRSAHYRETKGFNAALRLGQDRRTFIPRMCRTGATRFSPDSPSSAALPAYPAEGTSINFPVFTSYI